MKASRLGASVSESCVGMWIARDQRGGGLLDLGDLERLGDVEDLVRRPRDLADLQRREVGKAGDDHQVDGGV